MEDRGSKMDNHSVQSSIFNSTSSMRARRGFSFAEVMFAVVILGIGFIMVAAVFPVAIHQTQSNGEENSAANAARAAAVGMAALPMTQPYIGTVAGVTQLFSFPPTVKNYVIGNGPGAVAPPAIVVPFVGPRWEQLKANLISSLDPRYSYVPFYRRENNSPVAELIVIAVTNRNHAIYSASDVQNASGQSPAVPQTQYLSVQFTTAQTAYPAQTTITQICPDSIAFTTPPTGSTSLEGATVNVPNLAAVQPTPTPVPPVYPTQKTYLIGRPLTNANSYELCAPDGIELSAGSGGLWGAGGGAGVVKNDVVGLQTGTLNLPTTLQPVVAYAQLLASPSNPSGDIEFFTGPSAQNGAPAAATPGAFVIVADDCPCNVWTATYGGSPIDPTYVIPPNSTFPPTYQVGALNGRIFRLGQPVAPSVTPQIPVGTFSLDPAYGMRPGGTSSPDSFYIGNPAVLGGYARLKVYIIGAGNAGNTNNSNAGAAQDMGIFATYIQVQ